MIQEIIMQEECLLLPEAPILFSNATSVANLSYHWDFGDGSISEEQTTSHAFANPGIYSVVLTIHSLLCDPVEISLDVEISAFDQPNDLIISSQSDVDTWLVNNATFGGDVYFQANSTPYTIANSTYYFGPSSDLIIEQGADVRFKQCVLTSCTNWNGIDVRANSASGPAQGKVAFDDTNNQTFSIVEHARIAIETNDARPNANTTSISSFKAGHVSCNRTRFLNNLQAVRLYNARMFQPATNVGFNRCTFIVDDQLQQHFPDQQGAYDLFKSHVNCSRIRDYHFKGCTFKNKMTNETDVQGWKNRGTGIIASASRFNVEAFQGTNVGVFYNGNFEGLDRGISTGKSSSTLRINNQNFSKNHIGIYLIGSTGSRIFKNTFHIGDATGVNDLDTQETYGVFPGNDFGITNDNYTSYEGLVVYKGDVIEIAENSFSGVPQANGGIEDTYISAGVRVRETLTTNMIVNKNNFSTLHYAALANGNNANGDNTNGLRFLCNTHNNPEGIDFTNADFLYNTQTLGEDARVAVHQKVPQILGISLEQSAGNLFTQSATNPNTGFQWHNEGVEITQYKHNGQFSQIPASYLGITNIGITAANNNLCPSRYGTSHTLKSTAIIACMIAQGETFKLSADNLRYLYLLTMDDGDTETLEDFVENTWGSQVWATREELLNISPFVSSDVLLKVLDNTLIYPHAMAFEILLANPNVLNEPSFVAYLSQKQDPMPESLIDLLLGMSSNIANARSTMETTLGDERTRQHDALDEAYWSMLEYEDDTFITSDFITVLEKMNTFNSECAIVELLFQEGQWNNAHARAQNIPNVVGLTKSTKREYEVYLDWVTFRYNLHLGGRDLSSMSPTEIQEVETIVQKYDTYAAVAAQEALNHLFDGSYFVPPAFGKQGQVRTAKIINVINESFVKVFPNPTDYLLHFQIKPVIPTTQICTLVVTDLLGKEVIRVSFNPQLSEYLLDTSHLSNGIYHYSIIIPEHKNTLDGKFEVLH